MIWNIRRWKVHVKRRVTVKNDTSVHERLYNDTHRKKWIMNKLTEETKRAKMKECTFTPKLIRKYVPPATGDERSVSAPMTRPSTSVFDKVTGNFKRKVETHVGARLYK